MKAPSVADLFCGAGGFSLGLKAAGFQPVFAADNDPYACSTYRANLGPHVHNLDFTELPPHELARVVNEAAGSIDVVAGGPPCQGWSVQRRGAREDRRNDLAIWFVEAAIALAPKAIVLENVPTLFGVRGRGHLDQMITLLDEAGYLVTRQILDASDYGVPQYRRRAVLVATRESRFQFPALSQNRRLATVRDAIGDLPPPLTCGGEHPDFSNHRLVRVSARNLERLRHVPEGGGRLDVPPHLQLPCHSKSNGHRHLDVYGRLWWDRPAGTITAMFDNFTRGRFGHPVQDRNITSREGARLQSFPDWFRFIGPKKDVARQIGNAVPPLLAEAIGQALLSCLVTEPGSREKIVEAVCS